MRIRFAIMLSAALMPVGAAHSVCGSNGATYVPRSRTHAPGVSYRLTILSPPRGVSVLIGWRYRFELLSRRSGRRLSRIDLDYICGMGRAPCAVWQTDHDEGDFGYSVVTHLARDLSPTIGNETPAVIIFSNFGEHDWTTALTIREVPGVRYFTRARVPPDLSDQLVWVRASCGRK